MKETQFTQPPKTEIVLQHEYSFKILTTCILAHLNNIAEPGSFNKHLNLLLKKNNLPAFTAEDDVPSGKIFKIATLAQQVSTSQESLNRRMETDESTLLSTTLEPQPEMDGDDIIPQEKPQLMIKPKPVIARTPASVLVLKVYTTMENPFPKALTNSLINEGIINDNYKYTYTTKIKTDEEIMELLITNKVHYTESDLSIVDSATYRKIRNGNADRSPAHQRPDPLKRQAKQWPKPSPSN